MMQTNGDMLGDRGDRYVADPAGVAHQVHQGALKLETTVQGVSAGHESSHLTKTGIQCLR
jgi:hypothetical protein